MISRYEEVRVNGERHLKHRYIWELHNGKIPKGYEVHHIDGNTHNNDISNLTLLSIKEHRSLHAKRQTGRKISDETKRKIREARIGKKMSEKARKKMSESYSRKMPVICVEKDMKFKTIQEAADFINKNRKGIYNCIHGKQGTCGNYHWMKGEDNGDTV